MDQLADRVLRRAERALPLLNQLEDVLSKRDDQEALQLLQVVFDVDHLVAQIRGVGRAQRIFAGVLPEEIGGETSSLLHVVRAAAGAVEHHDRLRIEMANVSRVGVRAHATDDLVSLFTALLNNAAESASDSAPAARVTAQAMNDRVVVRIEDDGIGIDWNSLTLVNQMLAGPVQPLDDYTSRHLGFALVVRVAHKHGLYVQLTRRQHYLGDRPGTIALVTIPANLLCEAPPSPPPSPFPAPSGGRRSGPPQAPAGGAYPPNGASPSVSVNRFPAGTPLPGAPALRSPMQPGGTDRTPNGLPVRGGGGSPGIRPRGPRPASAPPEDPAAGARAFAADMDAIAGGPHPDRPLAMGDPTEERRPGRGQDHDA